MCPTTLMAGRENLVPVVLTSQVVICPIFKTLRVGNPTVKSISGLGLNIKFTLLPSRINC